MESDVPFKDKEKQRAYRRVYNQTYREAHKEQLRVARHAYYIAHSMKSRPSHLLRKYGLTVEDFNVLFAGQDFKCGICGTKKSGGMGWHVDHCHDTNQVRGILCCKCNIGGGYYNHDPLVLWRAAEYFKKFSSSKSYL